MKQEASKHRSVSRRPSERVLETIAEQEGRDALEFEPVLSEVIDPDALDALFRGEERTGSIEFNYLGYRVQVRNDDEVTVCDLNG